MKRRLFAPSVGVLGLALVLTVTSSRADETPSDQTSEPQPDPESLYWKISPGTLPCGGTRDVVFTNSSASTVLVKLTMTCDCGEGAYATVPVWGDNITEKDNCRVQSGSREGCLVDVPAADAAGR